jgi:type II secretory pathway pseudopilin PulG
MNRPRTGISLIELIMAITILAFASMPVLGLFGRSGFFTVRNQDQLTAMNLCTSTLKGILNIPFKDVPAVSPIPLPFKYDDFEVKEEVTVNNTTFKCRLSVANVSNSASEDTFVLTALTETRDPVKLSMFKQFRRYDFRVEWVSRADSKTKRVTMSAYKADLQ